VTAREVLDGIKARLAAVPSLPWEVERYRHGGGRIWSRSPRGIRMLVADTFEGEGNRELLAAAPTDVARLTAAIEAVLRECDYLDTLADGDKHYAAGFRKLVTDALKEGQ
jgi:hypothetical protein